MPKDTIHFLLMGGTIDSFYDGKIDTVSPNKKSEVPNYIDSLKLNHKTTFTTICMKDSRSLTMADRQKVLNTIKKSSNKKFIITHGTYTMPDTARFLEGNLKKNATVVLTGSMIPLSFVNSDGGFNLGYSVSQISQLKPGIYICMNGQTLSPVETAKLISEGKFVSIFQK